MKKADILTELRNAGDFVSGQALAERLGVTRAAVWKEIRALREAGYEIESVNNRGYRLTGAPDRLSREEVLSCLGEHPWMDRLVVLESVDSTNNYAKRLAAEGAAEGTVVLADKQTGGRGRQGRAFASPPGLGVYLTVILRPGTEAVTLAPLTAMTAVAVCSAVEDVCGFRPGIKWTNDLVWGGKKLCGILTELTAEWGGGTAEYVVIGIGVNCNQGPEDFPEEVRPVATSLRQVTGTPIRRGLVAARMIEQLYELAQAIPAGKDAWLQRYAGDCVTVGQDVRIVRAGQERLAHADGIDADGGLLVTYSDGSRGTVVSGEVSVRGMYGYTD